VPAPTRQCVQYLLRYLHLGFSIGSEQQVGSCLISRYGVGYRSFTEAYLDSCGMFREAVIAILGAIAKQEPVRISERVRAGISRARAHGTRSGRAIGPPKVIFSRKEVVHLRKQGKSWRQIARECQVSPATVRRAYKEWPGPVLARGGDSEFSPQSDALQ
jgi:DNA invertase Pin-like site-specific DNA recombinase